MPFYIPPCFTLARDEERHDELYGLIQQAIGNPAQYDALVAEQKALRFFQPIVRNDYERVVNIVLHPQMLADFDVVEELGKRMHAELDRDVPEPTSISKWKAWLLETRRELCIRFCKD